MTIGGMVRCDKHGDSVWRGTMLCDPDLGGCGLVLMIDCKDSMRRPSLDRSCGSYRCPNCEKTLNEGRVLFSSDEIPDPQGNLGAIYTQHHQVPGHGRPICSSCFLDQVGRHTKPISDAERKLAAARKFRRKP